jgi:hypothetical protein
LLKTIKNTYIILDPIIKQFSVLSNKDKNGLSCNHEASTQLKHLCSSHHQNHQNNIIKELLDLDRHVSKTEPSWTDLVEKENISFQDFLISMQSYINHFKLDEKQVAAFNIICSSFILAQLDESSNNITT